MCDIAPFQMECEYDEYKHDLLCCVVCLLKQAFYNLLTEIPIVKIFVQPYHCEMFRMKGGGGDEEEN